ncbi:MAG: hypothetical protein M3322_13075, partial [Actinomycetota bacterium]|nr:hypothetical protein [Actinomycetota bacterium]
MSVSSALDSATAAKTGRGQRRLTTAPALRFFSWNGRTLAHVSAVPLPYVSLGDALAQALRSFDGGRT